MTFARPACILLLATMFGLLAPAPASAAGHHVMIQNYAYGSATLTVRAGDTVTWTNHDEAPHDVVTTSGPAVLRSPQLRTGQSWSHTFTAAGTYAYYCSVHPDMRAQVVVLPADTPTQAPPPPPAQPRQTIPRGTTTTTTTTAPPAPTSAAPVPGPAAVPAQQQVNAQQVAPAAAGQRLDPMLLVAGVVAAVAVLCLLLIGARPDQ